MNPAVQFDDVSLAFDEKVVLEKISFSLLPGRMTVFLGASGSGKSTVLRLILGLLKPDTGTIHIGAKAIDRMRERELMEVRSDIGMVFQEGALFDSLTVRENAGYRLFEETDMALATVDERVHEVLGFIGLADYADRMPSELSGGQRRRVAIARAMAAKPRLILYDEPTTGLDPITALTIDAQIIKLRDLEEGASIIVTHQLRDAFYIATHEAMRNPDGTVTIREASKEKAGQTMFVMLRDAHVAFEGSAEELRASRDEYLRAFLS